MSIISIFSGVFCREEEIVKKIIEDTGYELLRDTDIVREAVAISGISREKMERAFSSKTSVFNKFTHERERALAQLKVVLADQFGQDNFFSIQSMSYWTH